MRCLCGGCYRSIPGLRGFNGPVGQGPVKSADVDIVQTGTIEDGTRILTYTVDGVGIGDRIEIILSANTTPPVGAGQPIFTIVVGGTQVGQSYLDGGNRSSFEYLYVASAPGQVQVDVMYSGPSITFIPFAKIITLSAINYGPASQVSSGTLSVMFASVIMQRLVGWMGKAVMSMNVFCPNGPDGEAGPSGSNIVSAAGIAGAYGVGDVVAQASIVVGPSDRVRVAVSVNGVGPVAFFLISSNNPSLPTSTFSSVASTAGYYSAGYETLASSAATVGQLIVTLRSESVTVITNATIVIVNYFS